MLSRSRGFGARGRERWAGVGTEIPFVDVRIELGLGRASPRVHVTVNGDDNWIGARLPGRTAARLRDPEGVS
jgi:hypothetical protein